MTRFIEICVELRRGKQAKDGLHQYRAITQQYSSSLEVVLKHFLERAKEATKDAQVKAEGMALEIEDLDAEETSAERLLMAVSGEDSKDRADREVVTPWLKFLWETYRTILEILRNNTKLEGLYKETTLQAFAFCQKYRRINEFRRLSDLLRNHLSNLLKSKPLDSSESLQFQLDIRFAQLNTATALELWQEAYRTIQEIHSIIVSAKTLPPPQMMANFYEKLAQIFWVSQNYFFHAHAVYKFYETTRQIKNDISKDELEQLSTRVLLAALSIPPQKDEDNEYFFEVDIQREKHLLLAPLLGFPIERRDVFLDELVAKEIPKQVVPQLQDLFAAFEQTFQPLEFGPFLKKKLEFISTIPVFKQYTESILRVGVIKTFQQLSQVYQKMEVKYLSKLFDFLPFHEVEDHLIRAIAEHYVEARVDHKHNVVIFQPQSLQSDHSRFKLIQVAKNLSRLVQLVESEEKKKERAELQHKFYSKILATLEEEHKKTLGRRAIIEQIKEIREKQELEHQKKLEQEELQRQRMITEKNKEAMLKQAEEREIKRQQQIKKELEKEEAKAIAQRIAAIQKDGKVPVIDKSKLEENPTAYVQNQIRQLTAEREKMIQKLQELTTKMDYLVRARREVEIPLLQKQWEQAQIEDKQFWESQIKEQLERHKQLWELQIAEKRRLARMSEDRKQYEEIVAKKRQIEYEKALKEREEKLQQWRALHKKPQVSEEQAKAQTEATAAPTEGKAPQSAPKSAGEPAATTSLSAADKAVAPSQGEETAGKRTPTAEKPPAAEATPSKEIKEAKATEAALSEPTRSKIGIVLSDSGEKRPERESRKGPWEENWRQSKPTPTRPLSSMEPSSREPYPPRHPREPSDADRSLSWRKPATRPPVTEKPSEKPPEKQLSERPPEKQLEQRPEKQSEVPSHPPAAEPSSDKLPEKRQDKISEKPTEAAKGSLPSEKPPEERPKEPSETSFRPHALETPTDKLQKKPQEAPSEKAVGRQREPNEALPRGKPTHPSEGDWRSKNPSLSRMPPSSETGRWPRSLESNPAQSASTRAPKSEDSRVESKPEPSRRLQAFGSSRTVSAADTAQNWRRSSTQPTASGSQQQPPPSNSDRTSKVSERPLLRAANDNKETWRKDKVSSPSTTSPTTNVNTNANVQTDTNANENDDGTWETVPMKKKQK
jgi:translation initiation factor 3 subunit A